MWRIPAVNVEFAGREQIRAGIERLKTQLWEYLVQTTHPGTIQLDGDRASGRAYVLSFGRMRDGGSHLNYSVYHDRYQRTPDGWKFTERVDEVLYVDTTPLAGSPPPQSARVQPQMTIAADRHTGSAFPYADAAASHQHHRTDQCQHPGWARVEQRSDVASGCLGGSER
ncbi:nuclear transport factor 2 family protein [Micromonospora sp. PSH03]|uniref:nuclear transport factor 2 family protein n=1 Tax=Micromonospora salmantinae TaxID=2911211 RepID=UPI001EE93E92|nr:nuclear transport factor 2 family protein [Micromonospora salmantinae]MCG5454648.1 nuclear transport factor 2 family protein [Micromonospora salmantinae]